MLADRSQPIFPEPKQANTRVETSTRERSLPSVVAFSSQRSLCLRNVLSSATNVVSVLIFSIDFTRHSKHCVSPPSPGAYRARSGLGQALSHPFDAPFRSLFLSAPRGRNSLTRITPWLEGRRRRRMERRRRKKKRGRERGKKEVHEGAYMQVVTLRACQS